MSRAAAVVLCLATAAAAGDSIVLVDGREFLNTRLVEIKDMAGHPVLDPGSQKPIMKATKCDLCATNPGGPACVRACPHDALRRVDFQDESSFDGVIR